MIKIKSVNLIIVISLANSEKKYDCTTWSFDFEVFAKKIVFLIFRLLISIFF